MHSGLLSQCSVEPPHLLGYVFTRFAESYVTDGFKPDLDWTVSICEPQFSSDTTSLSLGLGLDFYLSLYFH